jgi:hypothetical protein
MASVISPSPSDSPELDPVNELEEIRAHEREKLRISKFDIVTSLFMALILFLGAFVLMLFIVWLLSGKPRPLPIAPLIENPAGRADNAEGFERDFEPPGAEEVEELQEPTLADTIEAVTDAVSTVAASLTTSDTAAVASTSGTGKGDSRPPGPEGEGDDIVPRFERWQLNFVANNMRAYAQQLDFYHIELGAFGGGVQGIDTASNLSGGPKKKTISNPQEEKRLYFSWKSATPLQAYDRTLLQQAGVQIAGRNIVRFIPNDIDPPKNLEHVLADIEKKYWESKGYQSVTQIAKTVFESKAADNGYAFEVIEQRYRKGK